MALWRVLLFWISLCWMPLCWVSWRPPIVLIKWVMVYTSFGHFLFSSTYLKWLGIPGIPGWAFLGIPGYSWAFLGIPGYSWAFLGIPGHSWAFLGIPGHSLAFLGIPWHNISIGICGLYSILWRHYRIIIVSFCSITCHSALRFAIFIHSLF